jgi:hypothetical protein
VQTSLLEPLSYQREVVEYLKKNEPELWGWSASADVLEAQSQQMRTHLLKAGYRLDPDAHPELAAHLSAVSERLGLSIPVTLYQAVHEQQINAMLLYTPGEAHIVFSGPILSLMSAAEQEALLGHELAHYLLWTADGGDFLVADRLLSSAAGDRRGSAGLIQTARKYRLYTEIFADRGALVGCNQLDASVSALVKAETGFHEVSAANYLRQADEIFALEDVTTSGFDHPELFIRARALRLWSESDVTLTPWLADTLEGHFALDELDLIQQQKMSTLTRRFIANLLQPKWFQSAPALAHARLFFSDLKPLNDLDGTFDADFVQATQKGDKSLYEYFAYLLLDFAVIDRDLEDLPLASALNWSVRLGLSDQLEKIAIKELGMAKKQLNKLKKEAVTMLERADASS